MKFTKHFTPFLLVLCMLCGGLQIPAAATATLTVKDSFVLVPPSGQTATTQAVLAGAEGTFRLDEEYEGISIDAETGLITVSSDVEVGARTAIPRVNVSATLDGTDYKAYFDVVSYDIRAGVAAKIANANDSNGYYVPQSNRLDIQRNWCYDAENIGRNYDPYGCFAFDGVGKLHGNASSGVFMLNSWDEVVTVSREECGDNDFSFLLIYDMENRNIFCYINGKQVVNQKMKAAVNLGKNTFDSLITQNIAFKSGTIWSIPQTGMMGAGNIKLGDTVKTERYSIWDITTTEGSEELQWSVQPTGKGVSIDDNGLLTVSVGTKAGVYTVVAEDAVGTVATKKVQIQVLEYAFEGNTIVHVVPELGNQKFTYRVVSEEGDETTATYSFAKDYPGLRLENGVVKTDGSFTGKEFVIRAKSAVGSWEKTVTVAQGTIFDFEDSEEDVRYINGDKKTVADALVTDGDNTYLDPGTGRWDCYNVAKEVLSGTYTIELDFLGNRTGSVSLASSSLATEGGTTLKGGQWWSTMNVGDGVFKYNGFSAGSVLSGWNHLKLVLNIDETAATVQLNDSAPVTIPSDHFYATSGLFDPTLSNIVCMMPIDNLTAYAGDFMEQSIESLDFDSRAVIPMAGDAKEVLLTATVSEDGEVNSETPVVWSLTDDCSFAVLNGDTLEYDSSASGTIEIKATIAGTQTSMSKNLTFVNSPVSFQIENETVRLYGTPNASVTLKLFGPADTTDSVSRFMAAQSMKDGATPFKTETIVLDENGKGSYSLGSLPFGRYHIYATEDGDIYYDSVADTGVSKLAENIIATVESPYFTKFISMYSGRSSDDSEKARKAYDLLKDKSAFENLMSGHLEYFYAAVAFETLLEQTSYSADVVSEAEKEFNMLNLDVSAFALLSNNTAYASAAAATDTSGGLEKACQNLKENAILGGIAQVVNKKDAKRFLAALGNSKYDSADTDGKNTIADAVANISFESIEKLEDEIDDVKLSGGRGGGGGKTSGGTSGGAVFPVTTTQEESVGFSDVPKTHWAYQSICRLQKENIINGNDGRFRPDESITRAEFVKMVVAAFSIEETDIKADFSDVLPQSWYYEFICRALSTQMINGYGGKFYPDSSITREDAVVITARALGLTEQHFETAFNDSDKISDYAKNAVQGMCSGGYINGRENGNFAPKELITRAEAAQLFYNVLTGGVER